MKLAPQQTAEFAKEVINVSIVIPVYQGEKTLPALLSECEPLTRAQRTGSDHWFRVREIILVNDGAIDESQGVIDKLAKQYPFVQPICLSRNFGQHAAILAGFASTTSEWVVTLDEDGQHNPQDIERLLDTALNNHSQLTYADPQTGLQHSWVRNQFSRMAKRIYSFVAGNEQFNRFNSFRLVRGDIARSLAAYCGTSVYLDVALSWVSRAPSFCPVKLRREGIRPSGYTFAKLFNHFMRLIFTSSKTPLRFVSLFGFLSMLFSFATTCMVVWQKTTGSIPVQGWTSLVILISFFSGMVLFSIGIIAEYLGLVLTTAMGRPLYLIVSSERNHSDRR